MWLIYSCMGTLVYITPIVYRCLSTFPINNPMQILELGVPPMMVINNPLVPWNHFYHHLNFITMSQTTSNAAPTLSLVEQLIAKNLELSKNTKSETKMVQVISIGGWKPNSAGKTKIVVTDHGTFFPLEASISNIPTSIAPGKPVSAKAVFTPSKDGNFLNMSGLEFEGVDTKTANMIRLIPQGAALFSLAV